MKGKVIWAILILAFIIRFVSVTKFPVGFNADEASFGYDAYSILKTGRDQWDNSMPLVLKSFGDFKSPLYSYISIPFVAILGLSTLAVRLPNVIIGTLSVLAIYLLVKQIVKLKIINLMESGNWKLEIVASFLLAINPWSIMLSRGAFEANLITFFLPMGIYFFLKGLENKKYLVWSALFFGLNLFTYHSAKLITPIVLFGLLIIFWKKIKSLGIKNIIFPGVVFSIFAILMVYTFFIGGGSRISERSITQGALEEGAKRKIELISSGTNSTIARALHNKYQVVVQRFVTNYFQYFSPKFLFTRGSSDSYYGMFPGIGTIYLFDGLMLLGVVPYLLKKNPKKPFFAVLAWLLIAPLPAALSTGAGYSGNRAMGMVPALQLIEIFGLVGWISIFSKLSRKITYLILFIVATLLVWNVFQFGKLYLKQIPQSSYREMGDGNLEVARWVESESKDKKVIISRSFGEPQIFFAFSEVWNPKEYQEYSKEWKIDDAKVNWVDQLPEYKLGKYTIKSVDWEKDTKKDVMIVARPDDFPKSDIPDKIFYYSNGVPSMYVKNY